MQKAYHTLNVRVNVELNIMPFIRPKNFIIKMALFSWHSLYNDFITLLVNRLINKRHIKKMCNAMRSVIQIYFLIALNWS